MIALWQTHYSGWGWADWFILIIVVAACCGIVGVALRVFGVVIPEWVQRILWIVACAVLAILAIRLIASL